MINHPIDWIDVLWYVLFGLICFLIGYLIGIRHAQRVKRKALQQLNTQAMELLDTKSALNSLEQVTAQQERKDRLLKLTLRKLRQSNSREQNLTELVLHQQKKHYIETAQQRLKLVQLHETAKRAATIAKHATTHLKRLEKASPTTQTIKAPAPKSYGSGDAVTVSVVDQPRLDTPRDAINKVSNRDSARLTKLQSSNEETPTATRL